MVLDVFHAVYQQFAQTIGLGHHGVIFYHLLSEESAFKKAVKALT